MKTHPNLFESYDLDDLRRLSAKVSDRIVHLEQLAKSFSETAVLKTPAQRPKSSKISKKAGIEYTKSK